MVYWCATASHLPHELDGFHIAHAQDSVIHESGKPIAHPTTHDQITYVAIAHVGGWYHELVCASGGEVKRVARRQCGIVLVQHLGEGWIACCATHIIPEEILCHEAMMAYSFTPPGSSTTRAHSWMNPMPTPVL